MKKILFIIMLLLPFISNVKAQAYKEAFHGAEVIPNLYIKKVKGDKTSYRPAKFIRNSNDNSIAYCIEPFTLMKENESYNGYDTNQAENAGISKSVWDKISLIAYYGYGYKNHTADKWYPITQNMIWKAIEPEGDFFFTDGLNGPKINIFQEEIEEINSLVNNHYRLPSFAEKDFILSINSTEEIKDTNQVLNDYVITSNNQSVNLEKDSNKLIIKTFDSSKETITFEKKFDKYNKNPIAFVDNSYQNVMTPGRLNTLRFNMNIIVEGGIIKIIKLDADTKQKEELGEGKLIGSIFELYNDNNELIDTLVIDENYEANTSKLLPFGNYVIKEKESMKGYLLNEKEYPLKIDSNNTKVEINIENQVIKSKIEIYKYYDNKLEPGISFEIYDINNNLIDEVTTDESGKIEKELYYGKYVFHQKNTTKNYLKVDDFVIDVDENSEKTIRIDLIDQKFWVKLNINKIDSNSHIIKDQAIFRIYDIDNEDFIRMNGDIELKTKNGILEIDKLVAGRYYLEEVKAPKGYKKMDNKIYFKIDDSEEYLTNNLGNLVYSINVQNQKIEVKVPNTGIQKMLIPIYKDYYIKKEIDV